jgi:hypothetical protein
MKFEFKQAAAFGSHDTSFTKGVHEVPTKVVDHHYFKKLQKAGLVVEHAIIEHAHKPSKVVAPVTESQKDQAPDQAVEEVESKDSKKKKR